jgi:bacterioferritin-associated ferredoxin
MVCLCRGLNEGAIRATVAGGVRTPEELASVCGAGADCGSCRALLTALIDEVNDGAETSLASGGRREGS